MTAAAIRSKNQACQPYGKGHCCRSHCTARLGRRLLTITKCLQTALTCLYWLMQVDAPGSRGVSRELAELQLPGEAVESEGKAAMVALMTALPFGVAAGWMLLVAKSSQRMGELPFLPGKHCTAVFARLKFIAQFAEIMDTVLTDLSSAGMLTIS